MRRDEVYFGALGVLVGLGGLLAVGRGIGLAIPDPVATLGVVTVSGTFLLWRGVILLAAGAFYLQGVSEGLDRLNAQATVFLGTLMLVILAGAELLSVLLGAIPGGADRWVASGSEIVAAVGPPYTPAVVTVPFALVAINYWSQEAEP
ncbi:MAG: hypothetical protein J07HN4v3_00146 [Halonotius sp. J07HN4]|nr:MAG: hypothetical protein J07HN4v3_00146 [Halonotius sp. J07HN4]